MENQDETFGSKVARFRRAGYTVIVDLEFTYILYMSTVKTNATLWKTKHEASGTTVNLFCSLKIEKTKNELIVEEIDYIFNQIAQQNKKIRHLLETLDKD